MLATSLELLLGLEPLPGLLCHPRIPEETASHQELSGENVHSGMNVLLLLSRCQEDAGTGGGGRAQKGQVKALKPLPPIELKDLLKAPCSQLSVALRGSLASSHLT